MSTTQLDKAFWNNRYINEQTGWDLGEVSPPIKSYINKITNKEQRILIPGAGNAYELEYLLSKGFKNVTVIDIAPQLIEKLKKKYQNESARIIEGDFFKLDEEYELVFEQTFFCALDPIVRPKYIEKMSSILTSGGKLCGVLFNRQFEGGPPFGGSKEEYESLFNSLFHIQKLEPCYNSHSARQGNELWLEMIKK